MTLNTFEIHTQLAMAIRNVTLIREEMAHSSLFGRFLRQLKLAYLNTCIDGLTWQLRGRV